jgi:FKBP-type peptidyl-prolyl cis-trans isomerase
MRRPAFTSVAFPVLVLVASIATACGGGTDSPTSPSTQPRGEFSQTDMTVGTGAEATAGRRLTVHYTLWQYDPARLENKGTQYQSSVGAAPFGFTLGAGGVIRGWDQGVVGMRVGGRRRLVLPPELAYGAAGNPPIPPNATLIFEIELLDVQ